MAHSTANEINQTQCTQNVGMLTSKGAQLNYAIFQYIYLTLAIITITSNTLVLFVMFRLKYYRVPHHFLLVMLSITDILTGLSAHPTIAYEFHLRRTAHDSLCSIAKLTSLLSFFLTGISMTTIALITFEMYYSITRPFKSTLLQRYVKAITLIWILMALYSITGVYFLPNSAFNWFKTASGVLVVMTYTVICVLQMKIIHEAKRITKRQDMPKSEILVKAAKMTKTILVAFGCCYCPFVIVNIFLIVKGSSPVLRTYVIPAANLMILMNPLTDPFVYCVRLKAVRMKIVRSFCHSPRKVSTCPTMADTTTVVCNDKETPLFTLSFPSKQLSDL